MRILHNNLAMAAMSLAATALAACEPYFDRAGADAAKTDAADSAANSFAGLGIGGACKTTADCREGLTCDGGKCAAKPNTPENGKCLLADECQAGLHCSWAGFCTAQPAGTGKANDGCEKTADCGKGMFCKQLPVTSCAAGSSGCGACTVASATAVPPEGEECTSAAQCPPGMLCDSIGLSGVCKNSTGQGDIGAKCAANGDCRRGLACSATRKECIPGSLLLNPDLFPGVECNDEAEAKAPFGAVLHVPRAGVAADYYAMPFPNDIRKKGANLDLTGHPRPGLGVIGFDAVDRVAESMAADMTGWGQTTAAYLRFTRTVDPKTIKAVPFVAKEQATVRLINLKSGVDVAVANKETKDSKDSLVFHEERNKYICRNWLYVHARWSEVLDPDTPYAVVVTDGIREACGNGLCDKTLGETNLTCANDCTDKQADTAKPRTDLPAPARGTDLDMLLADAKPTDTSLEPAWNVYAPLRAFLKANAAVKPITATVFTTTNSRKFTQQLADLVGGALKPAFAPNGAPVVCAAGVKSPCADDTWAATPLGKADAPDPRACPANADKLPFYEIHAKLSLPYIQNGKRPYLTYTKPSEKKREGAANVAADGKPALVDYENICVAITIPKGPTKPAAGWPVALFGHGTGGSFRSAAEGMAAQLAVPANTGSPAGIATIGFDAPMHANRRGTDDVGKPITTDPGPLFYNFANPAAARGNFWQGATDKLALFRFAKEFQGEGINNAAVGKVHFDPNNLLFFGHSQGATTGPLAVPYMNGLKGAVFSGCGGSLAFGLLGKKKPIDASVGMQIGLQDLGTDPTHPVLNLLQNYFESSDPLLYAQLMHVAPVHKAIHVMHTYGHGDSFTPPTTSRIFAAAARLTGGLPDPLPTYFDKMDDLGVTLGALPLSKNVGGAITAVSVQAKNDAANSLAGKPYDGHFVAFNDKTLVKQVLGYVGSLVQGNPVVSK